MLRNRSLAFAVVLTLAACGGEAASPVTEPTAVSGSTVAPSLVSDDTPTTSSVENPTTSLTQSSTTSLTESPPAWPADRIHSTFVYDPVGEHLLMLSGLSQMQREVDLRDVWSLDTNELSWTHIGASAPPDALMTFGTDTESSQIVAFNMVPAQTWSYDLTTRTWEPRQPSEQPESTSTNPRFGVPLTYDTESDRLILFAGGSPWHMYTDTWAYDTNTDTWERMNPPTGPSPRAMYATAYDAESDRVLLWGGFTGTEEDDVQMWAYDYNSDTWEALANTGGPQQHWERHGMTYIPELDRVLFYSGMLEEEGVLPAETWYYDYNTNTWTEVDVEASPPGLAMYAIAYDPVTKKAVIFGGEKISKYAGYLSSDIWTFDPETESWTQIPAPSS